MKTCFRNVRTIKCSLSSIRSQLYIQRFRFCDSKLEFADLDNENRTNSDYFADNELYQSVTPDPSARIRHSNVEIYAWRKQSRNAPRSVSSNHKFSDILNARSIADIRKELDSYKRMTKRGGSKNRIMDILDSIAANDDDEDKSDANDENDNDAQDFDDPKADYAGAYAFAIEACNHLGDFDAGFALFEEAKQNRYFVSQKVYGNAMLLTMQREFSLDSLHKCHDLLEEMKRDFNLQPSAYIYAILIQNQTALRHFFKSEKMIKEMQSDERTYSELMNSRYLRSMVCNHYAKSKQIEQGIRFMDHLAKQFGDGALNDSMYAAMLTGIALMIKDGDQSFIKVAEKLFEQSFKVLGRPPDEPVFSTLLSCYANIPDTESCIDMVKNMVSNPDWPKPTGFTFSNCLKSLTMHFNQPISYEQGWKLADEILHIMNTAEVTEDRNDQKSAIYGLLFTLCGGRFCNQSDLDKLYKYYDEMKSKGYRLNLPTANSLLLSGIDHYVLEMQQNPESREEIKEDLKKYIDWALLQFKENNLSLNARQNQRLHFKLSKIM